MSLLKKAARTIIPEQIYDAMRRARQARVTRRFPSYEAQHRFGGRDLRVFISDPVAAEWYDHEVEANPEIDFLRRLDLAGGTIFDLGAHQCVIAILLSDLVGETGKVVAVEANSHNYDASLRNLALNGKTNITCLKALVSSGRMQLSIDGGLNGRARAAGSGAPETEILTIDHMTAAHGAPALVLLDIEGHEIEALSSASRTINDTVSHWLIELHGDEALSTYGHQNSDIFRYFKEEKFVFHVLEADATEFRSLTRETLPKDRCHIVFERRT